LLLKKKQAIGGKEGRSRAFLPTKKVEISLSESGDFCLYMANSQLIIYTNIFFEV